MAEKIVPKTERANHTSTSSGESPGPLLVAWKRFVKTLEGSDEDEVSKFVEKVGRATYISTYPRTPREPVVSFNPDTLSVASNVEGFGNIVQASATRDKALARLFRMIASGEIEGPTTMAEFKAVAQKNLRSHKEIVEAVRIHANDGTIRWNTKDGRILRDEWDDYGDWSDDHPTQENRRTHAWEVMLRCVREPTTPTSPILPRPQDMPLYLKANKHGGEWWRCVWDKDGTRWGWVVDAVNTVEYFPGVFRNSRTWKTVVLPNCDKVDGNEDAVAAKTKSPRALYILALYDEDVPMPYRWQAYVGMATDCVRKRWFAKRIDTHLTRVRECIENALACRDGQPKANLVDVTLARVWLKYGTWKDRAFLFVVQTGVEDDGPTNYDKPLCKSYKLKHPRWGLNMKDG